MHKKTIMIDRLNNQAVDLQNALGKQEDDFKRQLKQLKNQVEILRNEREKERLAADNQLLLEKQKSEDLSRKLNRIQQGLVSERKNSRLRMANNKIQVLPVNLVNGRENSSSDRNLPAIKSKTESNVLTIRKQKDPKKPEKNSTRRRRKQNRKNRNKKSPPRCSDFDHKTGRSYSKYCKTSWSNIQQHGPGSRQFCSLVWHCINPNLSYTDLFDYRMVCKRTCWRIRKRFFSLSQSEGRNICDSSFKVDFETSMGCNYEQDNAVCVSHGVYKMRKPEVFKCF